MLSEERVKLMTKMAVYEKRDGARDFKINSYFSKDYASWNVIWTLIWVTLGYILAVAMAAVAFFDFIVNHMNVPVMIFGVIGLIAGYVVILICYGMISSDLSKRRHEQSRIRVKRYDRQLRMLDKLYKKEKK